MTRTREDDARRLAPAPKVRPTAYEAALKTDAAAFDSLRRRIQHRSALRRDRCRCPGRITGNGSCWSSTRRRTTLQGINRAWKQGARCRRAPARRDADPYTIRGLSNTGAGRARAVAVAAAQPRSRPGRACVNAHRPLPAVDRQHGRRLERWVLEPYASRRVAVHPEDFSRPLAQKSTSDSWPTMRGCGRRRSGGPRRARRRRWRCVLSTLSADR